MVKMKYLDIFYAVKKVSAFASSHVNSCVGWVVSCHVLRLSSGTCVVLVFCSMGLTEVIS